MKLYFSPGACSLAVRIALTEAGLPFAAEKVDLRTHQLADGTDYYAINPKGYVPLLELADGTRLTEVPVLLQYVADRVPGTLAPEYGSIDRYRVMEWLGFIATELHKQCGPLWNPGTPDATKDAVRAQLGRRLTQIARVLAAQPYLTGQAFGIADAYLFTILNWAPMLAVDLSPYPALAAFQARVAARPAVRRALVAEELVEENAAAAAA